MDAHGSDRLLKTGYSDVDAAPIQGGLTTPSIGWPPDERFRASAKVPSETGIEAFSGSHPIGTFA